MLRILVTGAGGSAAHNFISSLKLTGEEYYIVGSDTNKYHLELAPVNKRYILPRVDEPDYLDKLNELIELEKIDFVHPQPDVEVEFISQNADKIKAKTFTPKFETIEICQNKAVFRDLMQRNGVNVPEAFQVFDAEDLKKKIENLFTRHEKVWVRAIKGAGAKASLPVINYEQALSWINYWIEVKGLAFEDFMISEFLPNREFAFQSIWKDGELITSQARERLEYVFGNLTPSGQSSSPAVAKTVHDERVNEMATKSILAVDPKATGIFCADIKENKNGDPCLIEINAGRFFTTSNFFSEAGSNMPYYYLQMAFGEPLPELPKYNALEKDLYWVRVIDMGYKLVKEGEWTNKKL